jgi:hypothetical protein
MDLCTNIPFVIHVIAYGINIGVFSAIGTLLNPIVLQYFSDSPVNLIYKGFLVILCCFLFRMQKSSSAEQV